MTNLNSANIGMNKFCGPAVLSILTGKSTDECAKVISSINGKYRVEGVQTHHLLEAASRLGFDAESVTPASSLYGSLVRLVLRDGIYIVSLDKHFVVIEVQDKKIYFCDNHTKEPMPASSSARLQQRVAYVHKVTKRREPILISSKISACKKYSAEGAIEIEIYDKITYDMPKYDKTITIARFTLATEQDFDEFINSMKEGY